MGRGRREQTIGKPRQNRCLPCLVSNLNLLGGHGASEGSYHMYRLTTQERASAYGMFHAISGGPQTP